MNGSSVAPQNPISVMAVMIMNESINTIGDSKNLANVASLCVTVVVVDVS